MERHNWTYRFERLWRGVNKMVEQEFQPRKCKYCGSYHLVRWGHSKHIQRLLCRDCHRTFMDTDALPGMRTPKEQIASALSMYYEGMSLNTIRRHLQQVNNIYPSDSTVYDWITKFTEVAIKEAEKYKPNVGDTWVADETVIKIGGKKVWLIDLIDSGSRYLLGTKLSHNRNRNDIRQLMELASERAGKEPKEVLTDGWKGYLDGIELAFGADAKHIQTTPFNKPQNTELIERFHGTLKDRTKVMRGLKERESAKLLLDGWLVHYNYFRPHESLDGKTPAEFAGVKFPYRNWADITSSPIVTMISVKPRTIRLNMPVPRISLKSTPRISQRAPRITPKTPRISNGLFVSKSGAMSRHPFRGARRIRG